MQKQSELITLLRETICKESPERLPKLHKVNHKIQGCLANSDGANSDDRANSDDFLGKSLNFFPSYFLLFLGILTT